MSNSNNSSYRDGYKVGHSRAVTEISDLIREEIDLYTRHTPEQRGKINALEFLLGCIRDHFPEEVSR